MQAYCLQVRRFLVSAVFIAGTVLFLSACSSAKTSSTTPQKEAVAKMLQTRGGQITESDIMDIDVTLEITEEDIRDAFRKSKSKSFRLAPGARIVLVQAGNEVPNKIMQDAMAGYFQVSVYSGVQKKTKVRARDRASNESRTMQSQSYIKSLRLAAANGNQDKIVVYWSHLEVGEKDKNSNTTIWYPYKGTGITKAHEYIRFVVRFALVDTETGNWVMYAPTTVEQKMDYSKSSASNSIAQIQQLNKKAYMFAAADLAIRYR